MTKESLFFLKKGVSDIFLRKKFVMSLFCIIFAFENGQEAASLGFALGSLCLRSGFAPESGGKVETKRRQNGMSQEIDGNSCSEECNNEITIY